MKKLLPLAAILLLLGAGCVNSQSMNTHSDTPEESLSAVLQEHDLGSGMTVNYVNGAVTYPWRVTDVIANPSGKNYAVVFGEDQSDADDDEPTIVPRGFYILHGSKHLPENFFMVPGAREHVSLGDVAWQNDNAIEYEIVTTDEDGVSKNKQVFTVVDP